MNSRLIRGFVKIIKIESIFYQSQILQLFSNFEDISKNIIKSLINYSPVPICSNLSVFMNGF